MTEFKDIKINFPFFKNNPALIFLDSASTTQKPEEIINLAKTFYEKQNSNAGRSTYKLGTKLTSQVEHVREKVRNFINADSVNEVAFTSGATDSFNKIAQMIGFNLKNDDEILYSPEDHKSFVLPWMNLRDLLSNYGINIKLVPYKIKSTGGADILDILSKITPNTKVINITHINNVYGADSDIHLLRKQLQNKEIIINVDGTQAVGHMKVDVRNLDCDIYSFSGHKMFALQGVGVSYVKKDINKLLKTIYTGGGNPQIKFGEDHMNNNHIKSLESGTQNYVGILSLEPAIDFIQDVGEDNIRIYNIELTQYLLSQLKEISDIEFTKGPYYWNCYDGFGIVSFKHLRVDSTSIGFILDQNNICVRTGDHCMMDSNDESVRVSLHIYNTKEEIDKLISILKIL